MINFPIDRLRSFTSSFRPESCDVLRTTSVSDGMGGYTTTETVVGTYPCRRSALSGSEAVMAEQFAATITLAIHLPWDADVTEADRIRVAGETYEVSYVPVSTPEYTAELSVLVSHTGAA